MSTSSLELQSTQAIRTARGNSLLESYFYFLMSLLISGIVVYGFSHTIDANLIHPAVPRPFLLYVHATVFSGWLVFFILQSALVRTRHVRMHRSIGWFGLGMGAVMPVLGVATAVTMGRFDTVQLHQNDAELTLIIPFFDMAVFASSFGLAMYWRTKPEFHRRLILIACCALTAAAFGRFPARILPPILFYSGVDLLILLGVARDLIVSRSIHAVYRYALPAIIAGQIVVMYTVTHSPALWMKFAHAVLR
jgi:hypothetical protein